MNLKNKIGIIIQTRSKSSRFKYKFKKKILNKSLINFLIDRIQKSIKNSVLVVCVPKKDKLLAEHLRKIKNIKIFYGSENNVLDRYYKCSLKYKFDNIIRLTGDNPFVDLEIIKKNLFKHIKYKKKFTTNCYKNTFPNGLEFEIINVKLLKYIWKKAILKSDKEHVTPMIYRLIEKKEIPKNKISLITDKGRYKNIRITVDKKNDLKLINQIYKILIKNRYDITFKNIIKVYKKNKKLFNINKNEIRDEGYLKSLLND